MVSKIIIELEVESQEEGVAKLENIIEKMREGYIEGEGWKVLANAFEEDE